MRQQKPDDITALSERMTDLLKQANDNGVAREDIKRVLERQAEYADSERGREELNSWDELHGDV